MAFQSVWMQWEKEMAARSAGRHRSAKSAVERTGNGRKEPCRQAVMVLQHENMRANALELAFHDAGYSDFSSKRQFES
jgi:hypothetical protein